MVVRRGWRPLRLICQMSWLGEFYIRKGILKVDGCCNYDNFLMGVVFVG